jgi:hypothetical protein
MKLPTERIVPMNASKEEARKAMDVLRAINNGLLDVRHDFESEVQQLAAFLEAAERKLPSEAAFKRAKAKRK